MCNVAKYLEEQTEECRRMAQTAHSAEWAQISLILQREQSAHASRCKECRQAA